MQHRSIATFLIGSFSQILILSSVKLESLQKAMGVQAFINESGHVDIPAHDGTQDNREVPCPKVISRHRMPRILFPFAHPDQIEHRAPLWSGDKESVLLGSRSE